MVRVAVNAGRTERGVKAEIFRVWGPPQREHLGVTWQIFLVCPNSKQLKHWIGSSLLMNGRTSTRTLESSFIFLNASKSFTGERVTLYTGICRLGTRVMPFSRSAGGGFVVNIGVTEMTSNAREASSSYMYTGSMLVGRCLMIKSCFYLPGVGR